MVITIELVLGQPELILLNNSESGWQKIRVVKMVIIIDLISKRINKMKLLISLLKKIVMMHQSSSLKRTHRKQTDCFINIINIYLIYLSLFLY